MTSIPPSQTAHDLTALTTPRPISEYHQDMGDVIWWKFPVTEAPYIGSPLDLGYTVEAETELRRHGKKPVKRLIREMVGGWPGYHTHFTPIPKVIEPSSVAVPTPGRDLPVYRTGYIGESQ